MNILKLFGGNCEEDHPISSNRHKKIRYIYRDLETRLGKETADQIKITGERATLRLFDFIFVMDFGNK